MLAGRWWQGAFRDDWEIELVHKLELVGVSVSGVRMAVGTPSEVVFPDRVVSEVVAAAGGRVVDVVVADTWLLVGFRGERNEKDAAAGT